jgi:hypothetical protein
MWRKYRINSNISKARLFKLLTVIGELKTVPFSLLKSVTNATTKLAFTNPLINALVTDKVLEVTENGNIKRSVNYAELFKYHNEPYRHIVVDPYDSIEPHPVELKAFLYPMMFQKDYHKIFYPSFKEKHGLEPDACLILKTDTGYQIKFVEVERTDKVKNYLLDKRDKYISLGSDLQIWASWWKSWHKDLELPYCTKEDFCFKVLCKGKKTFDWEGWEWI